MVIEKWALYALASLILWGLWGFLLKQASQGISDWKPLYFYSGLANLAVVTILGALYAKNLSLVEGKYALLAFLAGVSGTIGFIALVKSLETGGKASIVIPLTSLYPAITVALAWAFLGEKLSPIKLVGILLALIAIILLSRP